MVALAVLATNYAGWQKAAFCQPKRLSSSWFFLSNKVKHPQIGPGGLAY
jgi:hypothetical protein